MTSLSVECKKTFYFCYLCKMTLHFPVSNTMRQWIVQLTWSILLTNLLVSWILVNRIHKMNPEESMYIQMYFNSYINLRIITICYNVFLLTFMVISKNNHHIQYHSWLWNNAFFYIIWYNCLIFLLQHEGHGFHFYCLYSLHDYVLSKEIFSNIESTLSEVWVGKQISFSFIKSNVHIMIHRIFKNNNSENLFSLSLSW